MFSALLHSTILLLFLISLLNNLYSETSLQQNLDVRKTSL
jgi:hypothetical protein